VPAGQARVVPAACAAPHQKPGGQGACAVSATFAAQKEPAVQLLVRSAVFAHARHEPAVHAAHAPAPGAALKKPGAHARPTPVSAVDVTVCDALTVPVHAPAVHGFGESVRMVVPAATPAPAMTMPTASEPDVTAEMESAALAIAPVATPVAVPAGQAAPAGHCAVHVAALRAPAAP
jgi:hypothetical protein